MSKTRAQPGSQWTSRIVGSAHVSPSELIAHDHNWRTHPPAQSAALLGAIDDIGFIRSVTVNQRTGRILDGHLRVELALETGQQTIPVEYVDLTEAEEALALLTLDPLAAMAKSDTARLDALLREVQTSSKPLQSMLAELAAANGLLPANTEAADPVTLEEHFDILIRCTDEAQQTELLERLTQEGYTCRSLIS